MKSTTVLVVSYDPPEGGGLGDALRTPGLYLNAHTADPLHAVRQALIDCPDSESRRRTLTLVDSHKKAVAAEDLYRGALLDARAYPKRTPLDALHLDGNCRNYAEVKLAEEAGLSAGMAVCPTCEHGKECRRRGYYRQKDRADGAQHAIATLARASADFLGFTADRDAVVISSDRALSFFRPPLEAHGERAKLLEQLADLRDAVQDACHRIDPPFWNKFYLLVDRVRNGVAALAPDQPSRGLVVPAAKDSDPPATWAVFLWKAIQGTSPRPPARLVRLLSAAACGQYPEVSIAFADERRKAPERGDGPKPIPPVELTALGTLPLPDKPIVVFAGESAEDFARATDRIVHGVGRPQPLAVPIWQAAVHMTAQARPKAAADLIRGYAARSGVGTIGVLMHRRASPAVLDQLGPLAKASGAPKLLIGHWRRDVAHLRDADLIVALGAPTIPPASIRRRLLQTGQAEAAAQPRDWGKLPWQATTAAGQTVLMPRMGYRHSAWQEAYAKALYTCVCRTLALIGKPAVLLTDEQLDFPVVQPPHRLSRRDAKILSALHVAAVARGGDTSETKTPKLLEDIYGDSLLAVLGFISAKCHPILAETLASLTDLKTKTVAGRLTVLRAAGYVAWNRSEGWTLPTAAWSPIDAPGLPSLPSSSPPRNSKPVFSAASTVLVDALAGLVAARGGRWAGPATALETLLASYARRNRLKSLAAWLGSADRIGRAVRRLSEDLKAAGVRVAVRRVNKARIIVLESNGGQQP